MAGGNGDMGHAGGTQLRGANNFGAQGNGFGGGQGSPGGFGGNAGGQVSQNNGGRSGGGGQGNGGGHIGGQGSNGGFGSQGNGAGFGNQGNGGGFGGPGNAAGSNFGNQGSGGGNFGNQGGGGNFGNQGGGGNFGNQGGGGNFGNQGGGGNFGNQGGGGNFGNQGGGGNFGNQGGGGNFGNQGNGGGGGGGGFNQGQGGNFGNQGNGGGNFGNQGSDGGTFGNPGNPGNRGGGGNQGNGGGAGNQGKVRPNSIRCDDNNFCGVLDDFLAQYGRNGLRLFVHAKDAADGDASDSWSDNSQQVRTSSEHSAVSFPVCTVADGASVAESPCVSIPEAGLMSLPVCPQTVVVNAGSPSQFDFLAGVYERDHAHVMAGTPYVQQLGSQQSLRQDNPLSLMIIDDPACTDAAGFRIGIGSLGGGAASPAQVFATSACIATSTDVCAFDSLQWTLVQAGGFASAPSETLTVSAGPILDGAHRCPTASKPDAIRWLHVPKTGTSFGNSVIHLMYVSRSTVLDGYGAAQYRRRPDPALTLYVFVYATCAGANPSMTALATAKRVTKVRPLKFHF